MNYRMQHDHENYLSFELPLDDARAKMGEDEHLYCFYNKRYSENWVKPNARFYSYDNDRSLTKIADISDAGHPTALVLNKKAFDILQPDLSDYGEFLPVNVEGIEYYIFNVLDYVGDDCIDHDKTEPEIFEGEVIGIKKLVFDDNHLGKHLIFKTSYDNFGNVFCQDELKKIIEDNNLTGILFSPKLGIWSGDDI